MREDHTPGSFLGLPPPPAGQAGGYAVIPVPYEGTVCFGRGTSRGPAAILDVSPHMEWYDEETGVELDRCGIVTGPPVPRADDPAEQMRRVYDTCLAHHEAGRFPLLLGGEHSITAPAVRAAADVIGPVSVLQLDAHADLRDAYTGGKYSHAAVMRRVSEITDSFVQVGVRSYSKAEADECPDAIARVITPRQVRGDWAGSVEAVLSRLRENVYVTVDMDVFDPSAAPGVGTPEPGGLGWMEATGLLRAVSEARTIRAADVVETAPIPGQCVTEFTAARLAAKIIAYTIAVRG